MFQQISSHLELVLCIFMNPPSPHQHAARIYACLWLHATPSPKHWPQKSGVGVEREGLSRISGGAGGQALSMDSV